MDVFAPSNLPGVGMGDLQSVAAVCGLVGLAVTSGALLAEGAIGTLVFVASALAVLSEKPDLGGSTSAVALLIGCLLLASLLRVLLARRARRDAAGLVGAAADSSATRAVRASIARREGWAQALAIVSVAAGGGAAGFAWAEWNEVPFALGDTELVAGIAIGVVAAAIGGDAAWRFLQGAVRAGGSAVIVGLVVAVAALALNSASVYVPFAGAVVLLLAVVLAIRLRRRSAQKYAGLRILG